MTRILVLLALLFPVVSIASNAQPAPVAPVAEVAPVDPTIPTTPSAPAPSAPVDAGPVLVALADTGSAAPSPVDPPPVVTVLPDPATASPVEAGSFVWKLYKSGHLVPALIVGLFFALHLAQKRIAWLRAGYRKVMVASLLAGLGMLAERVASGTTPNVMMLMGALGAAFTMWMRTEGEPKAAKA
jgi:hypothetical protein